MKLLALVLLLSAFSSLTLMEVVNSFSQTYCKKFFMKKPGTGNDHISPTIIKGHQYKKICQRWKNTYRFATLYDTERRIPVYSAYTVSKKLTPIKQDRVWKIEPQLDSIKGYEDWKDMIVSPFEENIIRNIKNQAVELDYRGTRYSKGHVFPSLFATDEDQAASTFTLTNIAPQLEVNNGNWSTQVEQPMHDKINASCMLNQNHPAYIVTGVVPGKKSITITRDEEYEQGINVPSHFWSAYCCRMKNGTLISGAYIAKLENFTVRYPSIDNLNKRLTELYHQDFRVFPGSDC